MFWFLQPLLLLQQPCYYVVDHFTTNRSNQCRSATPTIKHNKYIFYALIHTQLHIRIKMKEIMPMDIMCVCQTNRISQVTFSCLACAPSFCPVYLTSFLNTLKRHFQGGLFKISDFEVRGFFVCNFSHDSSTSLIFLFPRSQLSPTQSRLEEEL